MIGLKTPSAGYKPFRYPWAHTAWQKQQQVHWMPEEVQLGEDIKDWAVRLTDEERNFLTAIFRFFTQADLDVNENYMETYAGLFKPHEIKMMLAAFSNIETVHVAAYALLIETVGMPEAEFGTFMEYAEMREKHEMSMRLKETDGDPLCELINLAGFGAFTEGMQLFASFAMLMNFQRFGKMKGMCQIVEWSIRDESLHCAGITELFKTYRQELKLPVGDLKFLEIEITSLARSMVEAEFRFIDLAFDMGAPEGLTRQEMKDYVMYIADLRLSSLGYPTVYGISSHPLPWLVELINGVEHANFFETRSTEYSKGALRGSWSDAWRAFDAAKDSGNRHPVDNRRSEQELRVAS